MSKYQVRAVATKGGIDGESIVKGAASEAKVYVLRLFAEKPMSPGMQKIGLLAKFSHVLFYALLRRLMSVEERIADMEGGHVNKSLDFEAYDTMAEMSERLERVERAVEDLADHGFRYRGYWRDGFKAKKQDAITHNGSLWLAIRDTSDTPDNTSADWNVIARKGRDGRDAT